MSHPPRSLRLAGRTFNYSGRGSATRSHAYLEPTTGQLLTLFEASVVRTGPMYVLCRIASGDAVGTVRLDHAAFNGDGRLSVGDHLLVGPVTYPNGQPRAMAAWPLGPAKPKRQSRPPVKRQTGTIVHVAQTGTHGRVVDSRGCSFFLHEEEAFGFKLRTGLRVSFLPVGSDKTNDRATSARLA